tara:strand:- start:1193 stop:1759 length:567 start_codon:yes stop_codon:yes gene_type:complete
MATIFEDLTKLKPEEIATNSQFALEWFRTNIRRIFDRRNDESVYLDGTKVGRIIEGNMYMMFYDAKTKDKLPFWDRFPLIIPFDTRTVEDGFYAINLHYIPPMLRQSLLEELYKYPTNEGVNLDYQYFRSISRLSPAIPCVKRYLFSRIKRVPLQVAKEYWDVAAMLPTGDFGGVNKNTVYSVSRKQI